MDIKHQTGIEEVIKMKYWDMVKVPNHTAICPPTSVQNCVVNDNTNTNTDINTIIQNTTAIPAPSAFNQTSLNDDQISTLVSMLLEYKEKYFSEIPLMDELQKSFVWNLPEEVFNTAKRVWETGRPDCLNPVYWFYMFCVEPSIEAIAKFILVAYNAMKDSDFDCVESLADDYDDMNDVEHDESDESIANVEEDEDYIDDDIVSFAEMVDDDDTECDN